MEKPVTFFAQANQIIIFLTPKPIIRAVVDV